MARRTSLRVWSRSSGLFQAMQAAQKRHALCRQIRLCQKTGLIREPADAGKTGNAARVMKGRGQDETRLMAVHPGERGDAAWSNGRQ